MSKIRMLEGNLTQRADATDDCWSTPQQFIALLKEKVGVEFPAQGTENFIIYGFQTPGEDQKDKLWFKTDRAGHFGGFFHFVNGKWQRFYNHSFADVIWKYGDSRDIEPGFQLIDGSVQSIPVDVQTHIMSFYKLDIVYSTPLQSVFNYFAVIYLGV